MHIAANGYVYGVPYDPAVEEERLLGLGHKPDSKNAQSYGDIAYFSFPTGASISSRLRGSKMPGFAYGTPSWDD